MSAFKKFFSAFVAANIFVASNFAFASDLTLTPKQEYLLSQTAIRRVGFNCYEEELFTKMLDQFVEANSTRLRRYSDGSQRGIPHVYIMSNQMNNSYTSMGGDIIFSKDWISKLLYNKATGAVEKIGQPSLYRQSALVAVLGHECSHWYHADGIGDLNRVFSRDEEAKSQAARLIRDNDFNALLALHEKTLGKADTDFIESYQRYSMNKEDRADIEGLEFVNMDWRYSMGGMAMFLKASNDNGLGAQSRDVNEHKSASVRYQAVINHISKMSNGRVVIKDDLLYLDGKKFMGTGLLPARKDVTAYDRTMFVAGQLASSINRGFGLPSDKDGICAVEEDMIRNMFNNKSLLFARDGRTKKLNDSKAIDEFSLPLGRLSKLVEGTATPINDEERAVTEIINFLHRNR